MKKPTATHCLLIALTSLIALSTTSLADPTANTPASAPAPSSTNDQKSFAADFGKGVGIGGGTVTAGIGLGYGAYHLTQLGTRSDKSGKPDDNKPDVDNASSLDQSGNEADIASKTNPDGLSDNETETASSVSSDESSDAFFLSYGAEVPAYLQGTLGDETIS